MEQAQERLKYDVDVGREGLTGYYDAFITAFRLYLPKAVLAGAIWLWVSTLPASFDYRPAPDISVALIAKLCLAAWTVFVYWPLFAALRNHHRWRALERRGLQWVRRNDHDFRVMYYRSSDQSLQYDNTTREARLDWELNVLHYRWQVFWTTLAQLVGLIAFYILIPLLFAYAYQLTGDNVRQFSERWLLPEVAQWICVFLFTIPVAVRFCLTLYDGSVYMSGAQYIPGAKPEDPVIPEKTLETMRAEQTHGAATFVSPAETARQMSS